MTLPFKRLIVVAGLVLSSSLSFAQGASSAHASATIVRPIVVTNSEELSFNNIPISETGTNKSKKRTTSKSGIKARTSFFIDDEASYVYSINLPSDALTCLAGNKTMTVQNFSSARQNSQTQGSQKFYIEAVLRINSKSAIELNYFAQSFDVMINYN